MHKRGERRSQRASTMSFNSVSEAEKCIEMSLKWSFFSGGEEEEEEEEGGVIRWCSSTFLDRRRPKHQVWSRKRNREVLASTKDQHKVCVSGANKVRNLKILGNRFTARCRSSPPGCSSTKTNHLPAGASAGSQQGYKQAVLDLVYVSSGETGPEYHSCDLAFFFLDLTKGQKYFSPRISL